MKQFVFLTEVLYASISISFLKQSNYQLELFFFRHVCLSASFRLKKPRCSAGVAIINNRQTKNRLEEFNTRWLRFVSG